MKSLPCTTSSWVAGMRIRSMADIKQDCIPGLCQVEVAGGGMG